MAMDAGLLLEKPASKTTLHATAEAVGGSAG